MANKVSAIKRNRQNEKRRVRNRIFRGRARTSVKNAMTAIEAGSSDDAQTAVAQAVSDLDKAAEKGVIHKNNAARRKGRIMKKFAAIASPGNASAGKAKAKQPRKGK